RARGRLHDAVTKPVSATFAPEHRGVAATAQLPCRALPRPSALWHGRGMPAASLAELLVEYDRARAYTRELWSDLNEAEVRWRPHANSSAIGWHLGHQPAV